MTTYDPVTLDAVAVTDPNGHTTRLLRDGLRRVVQTIDGAGRITAQRDHRFSRGISSASVYDRARPNRQTDIAYSSRDGHKDLSADGHRVITRGTGDSIREGVSLATGRSLCRGIRRGCGSARQRARTAHHRLSSQLRAQIFAPPLIPWPAATGSRAPVPFPITSTPEGNGRSGLRQTHAWRRAGYPAT